MPPLTYLGIENDGRWTETDRQLTLAYRQYEANLCPCCGIPKRFAHDDRMDGWYEASEEVCMAGAARDRWRKDHKDPEPGLLLGIKDTRTATQILSGEIPR